VGKERYPLTTPQPFPKHDDPEISLANTKHSQPLGTVSLDFFVSERKKWVYFSHKKSLSQLNLLVRTNYIGEW